MVHCKARMSDLQADDPRAQFARSSSAAPNENGTHQAWGKVPTGGFVAARSRHWMTLQSRIQMTEFSQ